jgi:amino-acid N-acetyltransferase
MEKVKAGAVERARIDDVPRIHQLINHFADKGEMLHRPLSEIYENIRDYFVYREEDEAVACIALHVLWSDLAEIKAAAVDEDRQLQGVGTQLVQACLDEAGRLGIPSVFCLTYKPEFFERFGMRRVDLMDLPRKVWGECFRCAKFPDCDEIALIVDLDLAEQTK